MTTIRQLQDGDYVQLADLFDSHIAHCNPDGGCVRAGCESASQKADPEKRHVRLLWLMEMLFGAASHIRRFADDERQEAEIVRVVSWQTMRRPWTCSLNTYWTPYQRSLLRASFSVRRYMYPSSSACVISGRIRSAIRKAGFTHLPRQNEAAYAGPIHLVEKLDPPVPEVQLKRDIGKFGPRFRATLGDHTISECECCFGFSQFESIPAMRAWIELSEIRTDGEWRSKGIGEWVVQSAINWLHHGGYRNAILTVALDDEERGAGRFYSKFGWRPVCRMEKGWKQWTTERVDLCE